MIVLTTSTMRILALFLGMVWLAAVETSARRHTAAAAVVYERLLADRNTSCLLLFPEESAVCQQTRDCLDYFSRQLDFATFTSLCDVIQASAGGEQDARPAAGEDKRPGPAEARPFNHCSSLMFGEMLRRFQCCGSGMLIPYPTLFHPGSASKNLSILTPKNGF